MKRPDRRDPVKEAFWRKAIARFTASGLSSTKFCKEEGLDATKLKYWQEKIVERDAEKAAERRPPEVKEEPSFVPVATVPDRVGYVQEKLVAELLFSGGSLLFFDGVNHETMRVLVHAIREAVH